MAGLDMVEIERVIDGGEAGGWSLAESALLNATDDCHRQSRITPETLVQIQQHFNNHQQLDIMVTVGLYITLALIIKTWDVPMEDD